MRNLIPTKHENLNTNHEHIKLSTRPVTVLLVYVLTGEIGNVLTGEIGICIDW